MGYYDPQEFTEDLAEPGNFLVLTFTTSKSRIRGDEIDETVRVRGREHWFFKVESTNRITYRPYDAGTAVAAYHEEREDNLDPYIEPGEGVGPVPLTDRNGNEILRNDEDDWFVYHINTVPLQGHVRMYPQIPDSQPGGVFQYLGSNSPSARNGDPIGYVSGDDHPSYFDPQTGLSSTLVWNTGVNTSIEYQFYNEHQTRRTTPLLNITGAGYVLTPVVNSNVQRNLLAAANLGHDAVTHIDWGPIRSSFTYEVPSGWDDVGNYIEETAPSIPGEFRGSGQSTPELQSTMSDMTDEEIADVVRGAIGDD